MVPRPLSLAICAVRQRGGSQMSMSRRLFRPTFKQKNGRFIACVCNSNPLYRGDAVLLDTTDPTTVNAQGQGAGIIDGKTADANDFIYGVTAVIANNANTGDARVLGVAEGPRVGYRGTAAIAQGAVLIVMSHGVFDDVACVDVAGAAGNFMSVDGATTAGRMRSTAAGPTASATSALGVVGIQLKASNAGTAHNAGERGCTMYVRCDH